MSELIPPYHIDQSWNNDDGYEMATINNANHFWVFDCYASDADELLKRLNGFDQLQRENDELKARVKTFTDYFNVASAVLSTHAPKFDECVKEMRRILKETPQQSLAEIEAAAVGKAISEANNKADGMIEWIAMVQRYPEKLRQQSTNGDK